MAEGKTEARPGVQSLARAFALLETIGRSQGGIALSDLGREVGLHTSTAFHLVRTLAQLGYVRQDAATKRYHIGRPLFLLAAAALNDVELSALVGPVLEDLVRETGETAHFSVWSGNEVTHMATREAATPLRVNEVPGTRRPAYATAVGKVLLAQLEPDRLARYLDEVALAPVTEATITDRGRLETELRTIRESGLAFDDGEYLSEVRCAAMPVRDFQARVVGAVGISGPVWRLSLSVLQGKVPAIRAAADRIGHGLGAPEPC